MPLHQPAYFVSWHGSGDAGGYTAQDSTTYHAGTFPLFDPSSNYPTNQVNAQMATIIRSVAVRTIKAGAETASTESVTFAIRVNNATDFTIGTQAWNASTNSIFSGLSIAIPSTATWAIKWTTPVFSTNPTQVFNDFNVLHEIVGV